MIEKDILEKLYIQEDKKQREVAEILGVNLYEVQNSVSKYRLIKNKKSPINYQKTWDSESVEYLIEKFGMFSYVTIAKHLGRTVNGVKKKIKTLRLGDPRNNDECVSQNGLSKILKVDDKTIQMWKKYYKFKMCKKNLTNNQPMWRINITDFWKWAEKHKNFINWDKFTCGDLGAEPEWAMEERLNYNKPKKNYREWTKKEESLMISYYKAGVCTKKIAENLHRTQGAIKTRLSTLKQRKVIPKAWGTKEKDNLKELVKKGLTAKEIAVEMNRTVRSIERGKSVFITNCKIKA
jgi:hypothetical protein